MTSASGRSSYHDERDSISLEMESTDERLARLQDALETGKISLDELAPRIRKLRTRQNKLQARKIEIDNLLSDRRIGLSSSNNVTSCVNALRQLLSESPLTERREFIKSWVKEIKVTGDEVVLTYNMPALPDGISQERRLMPIVQCRGRYFTIDRTMTFELAFNLSNK